MIDIILSDMQSKVQYKLKSNSRLTIIRGNSGTGKSFFVKCLDLYKSFTKISIKSNKELRHINLDTILDLGVLREDIIYVMDEFDGINDQRISKYINNPKYTFIIITRDTKLPHLIYDIDDIYRIRESGKFNILEKEYNIYQINSNKECSKINSIQTEDSGSGLQFYRKLSAYDVRTSDGNSNINKNIKDNQFNIVDSIAFGPYIKEYLTKTRKLNDILLAPKSFEYLLLTSGIFKNTLEEFELSEKDYFKKLVEISKSKNIEYSKNKLDEWFLEDKQFIKIIDKLEKDFQVRIQRDEEINSKIDWGI